jgi:hypothetical protein
MGVQNIKRVGEGLQNMMKEFILLPQFALSYLAFLIQGFKLRDTLVRLLQFRP